LIVAEGQGPPEEPLDSNGLTEREFLAAYDPTRYERPSVTVDIALFLHSGSAVGGAAPRWELLLIKRGGHPWIGTWALPGGFVNPDETVEQAAERELYEETGVPPGVVELSQVRVFSNPKRDPRTRVITCLFTGVADKRELGLAAGDDAAELALFPIGEVLDLELAGDHAELIAYAISRVVDG